MKAPGADPYVTLGVARDADPAAVHTAYRQGVRRTHPDVGGSAAEFEAVQDAYETLRDPARRATYDAAHPVTPPPRSGPAPAADTGFAPMEDLLAESQRLENEARRLAGLPPRDFGGGTSPPANGTAEETDDSIAAILDDAQRQVRDVAGAVARELRRRARRML